MENRTPLVYISFSRGYLTGENLKSVILCFDNGTKIWVPKGMIKTSEFTLIASLGISTEFKYNLVDKQDESISGDELIALLQSIKLNR